MTCDCNTLWLRNLASETKVVPGEPLCYFPKALSGNPLRKLRTSRFTCDARSTDMIRDACTGIPLKKPVQEEVQESLLTSAPHIVTTTEYQESSSYGRKRETMRKNGPKKVENDRPTDLFSFLARSELS